MIWLPSAATMRLTIEPVPRFVEMYVETWLDAYVKGETNDQDEMPLIQIIALIYASEGRSFGVGPPRWLQRLTAPVIAAIARLRGYRVLG